MGRSSPLVAGRCGSPGLDSWPLWAPGAHGTLHTSLREVCQSSPSVSPSSPARREKRGQGPFLFLVRAMRAGGMRRVRWRGGCGGGRGAQRPRLRERRDAGHGDPAYGNGRTRGTGVPGYRLHVPGLGVSLPSAFIPGSTFSVRPPCARCRRGWQACKVPCPLPRCRGHGILAAEFRRCHVHLFLREGSADTLSMATHWLSAEARRSSRSGERTELEF